MHRKIISNVLDSFSESSVSCHLVFFSVFILLTIHDLLFIFTFPLFLLFYVFFFFFKSFLTSTVLSLLRNVKKDCKFQLRVVDFCKFSINSVSDRFSMIFLISFLFTQKSWLSWKKLKIRDVLPNNFYFHEFLKSSKTHSFTYFLLKISNDSNRVRKNIR